MPCTVFISAASALPSNAHGRGDDGCLANVETLCRVPDADATKSLEMVRPHSDVCRVGVWERLGSMAVVWGTSVITRPCGRKRRPCHGHLHVVVRPSFQ